MYRIRYIGDPVLRRKVEPIKKFDSELNRIVSNMIDIMHQEDGIGLAAPQVGLSKNLLVVDVSSIVDGESPRAFVNPIITAHEGESLIEEGCLSIPGVREEVSRPETITLSYQDEEGNLREQEFSGWPARVLQHEIDHLNGILFVDRISPLKRNMLINQKAIPTQY